VSPINEILITLSIKLVLIVRKVNVIGVLLYIVHVYVINVIKGKMKRQDRGKIKKEAMMAPLNEPSALTGKPMAAPASASFTHSISGDVAAGIPSESTTKDYKIESIDIIAIGILFLAISAALIAIIVTLGFVFGYVKASDGVKIVTTCVGGSTLAGIVAALLRKK